MKKYLIVLAVLLALSITSPVFAATPATNEPTIANGVDLFRGSWQGQVTLPNGIVRQINMYFNSFASDSNNANVFKASGYFSNDPIGGKKRADAPTLPMMASCRQINTTAYEVIILATFQIPPELGSGTTIVKFVGTAKMGGSSVTDDTITGTWYADGGDGSTVSGPWSANHLDRRNVKAPQVDINQPGLYFSVDTYCGLIGPGNVPPEMRGSGTILGVMSNIVMDSVKVTYPDGTVLTIPKYTDVFSPNVDWINSFRFCTGAPGMPIAGGTYTFTALDVVGNPIPGVQATDIWVGVEPASPPANVDAVVTAEGILLSWDESPVITGSFDPASGLGFYQLTLYRVQPDGSWGEDVFGVGGIYSLSHLIPMDKSDFVQGDLGLALNEMGDGVYAISSCVHSVTPAGSAGHGFEYNNTNPDETVYFEIEDGAITILE